jgi:O-antigen/teichoic acid export membrane protein
LLGAKEAGLYTNFLALVQLAMVLLTPFLSILFPIFSELAHKNKTQELKTLVSTATNILIIIGTVFG